MTLGFITVASEFPENLSRCKHLGGNAASWINENIAGQAALSVVARRTNDQDVFPVQGW
jgi:hypothetical protein